MKLFSWSSLFFILSLSFLWGCGYWVWLQTNQSQQTQLTSQLSLQLERSEVLLEDWQRNYRLHLDYLRADLAKTTPPSTDNVMYDPWQELDDKIQHAPWPDALLGYALLDESGRAVRLSNTVAGQLFAITNTDFSSNHLFLTPMVLPSQWVAPVHLELNSQHLLFWFDLAALKQKLLKAQQQAAGEVLLVSATAQLVSPSRYQQTLLARFGLSDLRDDQSLKFQLKRPPEDLTRSHQRYDGSMAWPATPLAQAMTTTKQGQTALFVPNYLGRPSVASWRWSDSWQAYLVAERDLSSLQQQRKQLRQYLLAGLSALSAVLLLLFWLIQRGVRVQEPLSTSLSAPEPALPAVAATAEAVTTPDMVKSDEAITAVAEPFLAATPVATKAQAPLSAATQLLQAWMAQSDPDPVLRAASACWLQQQPAEKNGPVGCQLRLQLGIWLSKLQQQLPEKAVLFDLASDVPAWAALDMHALRAALEWVIHFRTQQHDVSTVLVKTLLTTAEQLQLEISDDGETVSPGQWLSMLQPGPDTSSWPEPLRALQAAGGHLSAAQPQFSGNKLLLTVPLQIWAPAVAEPELQLIDGAALLLCPAGDAQQLYRRMLKQTGLALMPLDDAAQFMQWCSAQTDARLDYLILDESFINADLHIAAQVFQVVRRYFPQLSLLVLVRDPEQWFDLQQQFQLRLISKPVLSLALQQALQAQDAVVLRPTAQQVWFESNDPIEDWLLQQQLTALGFAPVLLTAQQIPANALLMLQLENRARWQSQLQQRPLLWYTAQQVMLDADEDEQLVWTFNQGPTVLSQRLFQLSERLDTDEN